MIPRAAGVGNRERASGQKPPPGLRRAASVTSASRSGYFATLPCGRSLATKSRDRFQARYQDFWKVHRSPAKLQPALFRFREVDQLHSEFPSSMDALDQQLRCATYVSHQVM